MELLTCKDHVDLLNESLNLIDSIFNEFALEATDTNNDTAQQNVEPKKDEVSKENNKANPTVLKKPNSAINKNDINENKKKPQDRPKNIEMSNNLIDTIIAAISRIIDILMDAFKKTEIMNNDFMRAYNKASAKYKPKENIHITNYQYNDEILTNAASKYKALIEEAMGAVKRGLNNTDYVKDPANILNVHSSRFFDNLMTELGIPTERAHTHNEMYIYIRDSFRGKKQDVTIQSTQIPIYLKKVSEYKNISKQIEKTISDYRDQVERLKGSIKLFLNRAEIDDATTKRLHMQIRNAGVMLTSFTHFMNYENTLRSEEAINAEFVIKKFYGITTTNE